MQGIRGYYFFVVGVAIFEGLRKNFYVSVYIHLFINEGVIMINLGKIIDKLIEISTTTKMPKDCRLKLDMAIEELIHFYFEYSYKNGNKLVICPLAPDCLINSRPTMRFMVGFFCVIL